MSFVIFALGSNGNGQLGIGHCDDVSRPTRCLYDPGTPPPEYPIRPIKTAAGGNHTLLLYSDGSVYAAGHNDDGRCGLPRTSKPIMRFTRVSFLAIPSETVNSMARPAEDVLSHFEDITATWSGSVFVASKDDKQVLYTCGSGDFGELGQGVEVRSSFVPRSILGWPAQSSKIVATASSFRHVVILTTDGRLYGWGNGRKGQLGKLDPSSTTPLATKSHVFWQPRNIGLDSHAGTAACGRDFTCVLHASGSQTIFGLKTGKDDKYGIRKIFSEHFAQARPGTALEATWNGVYLLAEDGKCTSFGKNDKGQLVPNDLKTKVLSCLKTGSEHATAFLQEHSPSVGVGMKNCQDELSRRDDDGTSPISCGSQHSGKIVIWGWTEHGNCGKAIPGGVEEGGYNCFTLPGAERIAPLGAGCATTFLLAEGVDMTTAWEEESVTALLVR